MHYPSYDGNYFQPYAMQAIYPLYIKLQHLICILYQNVLSIQVYKLQAQDSTVMIIITLIHIHYSMQESCTLYFREVLIIIWCVEYTVFPGL